MKVVIVAHACIRESNRGVYRRLAARGHDVTVVIPHRWKSVLGGRLTPEPEPAQSPLRIVVKRLVGRAHGALFFFPSGYRDVLDGAEPIAIYVDEEPAGLCALQVTWYARRLRAGLVLLAIQNILKRYPAPFNWIQSYVFAKASRALATATECAEVIRLRGFTGPIDIFNFGYELLPLSQEKRAAVRSRFGIGEESVTVGYVGRLVPEKGVGSLLASLQNLPGITGVIAGDGPEFASLRKSACDLGIAERVVFTGNLRPEDAVDLIGALDVCVLPSLTRQNWKEQFGRVLVEGMGQGVVVVGSSSGAIPETIGDAGLVFKEGDAADLTAKIRSALDPACRDRLIANGLRRVREEFSIDAVTDVLENALQYSLSGSAAT